MSVGEDAQKRLHAEHERLMAQAAEALKQKDLSAALEFLRKARAAQDTPQVREELSRVCVALADQAKELSDKIDLLSQAAEASPSTEINRVLAETKQRLRDQTTTAYADTLKRAAESADKGAWQDAVAAASEALRIAALQQLDPADAEKILVKAKEQLNLQAQFEAALQDAAKAETARQYAAAAEACAKAAALAGQMPSVSAAILNDLKAKAAEMLDRQSFDEAGAAWDKAAKAGEWSKAAELLARMKELAAKLKPAPAGAAALPGREEQTTAGLRRDNGLRRLAQAADELKRDEITAAKASLAEAGRLLGPAAGVEALGREIQARSSQLGAYVEALAEAETLWAQAQAVDDGAAERLSRAMAAARKALQAGPQCEPPPATMAAAQNLLANMRRLADTRRAALLAQAAEARAARNPAAALRLLDQAALLADPASPGEAGLIKFEADALRAGQARQEDYAARIQAGDTAAAQGRVEEALQNYQQARALAPASPAEAEQRIAALRDSAARSVQYAEALAAAGKLEQTKAPAADKALAWGRVLSLGLAMTPRPADLGATEQRVAALRAAAPQEIQDALRRRVEAALAAEERGAPREARRLYAEARDLAGGDDLDAKVAKLDAHLACEDAVNAAKWVAPDAAPAALYSAWRAAWNAAENLLRLQPETTPKDFDLIAKRYREAEAIRAAEVKNLLASADNLLPKDAAAALAALRQAEQLAQLAENAGELKTLQPKLAQAAQAAETASVRQAFAAAMEQAAGFEKAGRIDDALAACRRALDFGVGEEQARESIRRLMARKAAFEDYRAAQLAAETALRQGDILAALQNARQQIAAGERLDPPPDDLQACRDRLPLLEKQREALRARHKAEGARYESEGQFAEAIKSYRLALRCEAQPSEELTQAVQRARDEMERRGRVERQAASEQAVTQRKTELAQRMAAGAAAEQEDQAALAADHYNRARRLAQDINDAETLNAVNQKLPAVEKRAAQLLPYGQALEKANAFLRQRLYNEALAAYQEALEAGRKITPEPKDLALTAATIEAIQKSRADHAAELSEEAGEALQAGLPDNALRAYRRALALFDDPQSEKARRIAAAIDRIEKDLKERAADPAAQKLLQQQTAAMMRSLQQGDRFLDDGDLDRAAVAYEAALTVASAMRPQAAEIPLLREKLALARRKTAPQDSFLSAVGIRFVLIRKGSFVMGDNRGGSAEKPAHPVTLTRDYYMAATPVTAGQFQRYLIDAAAPAPAGLAQTGAWKDGRLIPEFANHPVTGVSFRDAEAFCAWLSKKEGRAFRLPTEAEWEYACRAGATTRFYWGDEPNPNLVNVRQSGRGATTPVASFPPNAWGLYDMIGNTCQWCQDVFGPYADGPRIDPAGSSLGAFAGPERRVVRGGWRGTSADDATCASRFGELTAEGYPWTGFRVAMDAAAPK